MCYFEGESIFKVNFLNVSLRGFSCLVFGLFLVNVSVLVCSGTHRLMTFGTFLGHSPSTIIECQPLSSLVFPDWFVGPPISDQTTTRSVGAKWDRLFWNPQPGASVTGCKQSSETSFLGPS